MDDNEMDKTVKDWIGERVLVVTVTNGKPTHIVGRMYTPPYGDVTIDPEFVVRDYEMGVALCKFLNPGNKLTDEERHLAWVAFDGYLKKDKEVEN